MALQVVGWPVSKAGIAEMECIKILRFLSDMMLKGKVILVATGGGEQQHPSCVAFRLWSLSTMKSNCSLHQWKLTMLPPRYKGAGVMWLNCLRSDQYFLSLLAVVVIIQKHRIVVKPGRQILLLVGYSWLRVAAAAAAAVLPFIGRYLSPLHYMTNDVQPPSP